MIWILGILGILTVIVAVIGVTLCRHAENVFHSLKWELVTTIEEENEQQIREIIESELEKDNKILAEMTIASEDEPELHQCPCCPATTCIMDTPCLGCETYGEWLNEKK